MGRPTASPEQNAAIRALAWAIVQTDHGGHQANAAKALGLTKAGFGKFLAGRTGYGEALRRGLERYLRVSFDEMLAAGGDLAGLRAKRPAQREAVEVTFGALPSWEALLAGAKSLDAGVPAWCWDELAVSRVWVAQPVTSSMLVDDLPPWATAMRVRDIAFVPPATLPPKP